MLHLWRNSLLAVLLVVSADAALAQTAYFVSGPKPPTGTVTFTYRNTPIPQFYSLYASRTYTFNGELSVGPTPNRPFGDDPDFYNGQYWVTDKTWTGNISNAYFQTPSVIAVDTIALTENSWTVAVTVADPTKPAPQWSVQVAGQNVGGSFHVGAGVETYNFDSNSPFIWELLVNGVVVKQQTSAPEGGSSPNFSYNYVAPPDPDPTPTPTPTPTPNPALIDTDGDGVADWIDAYPNDPTKSQLPKPPEPGETGLPPDVPVGVPVDTSPIIVSPDPYVPPKKPDLHDPIVNPPGPFATPIPKTPSTPPTPATADHSNGGIRDGMPNNNTPTDGMTKSDFADAVAAGVEDGLDNISVTGPGVAEEGENPDDDVSTSLDEFDTNVQAIQDSIDTLIGSFSELGDTINTFIFPSVGVSQSLSVNLPVLGSFVVRPQTVPGYNIFRWLSIFMIYTTTIFAALRIVRSGIA